jgi:enoyl-CoA hydratase/carnithine racemase
VKRESARATADGPLPRLVGKGRALELLTGQMIDAQGLAHGLVNKVFPADQLLPKLKSWFGACSITDLAVRLVLEAVDAGLK